MNTLVTRRALLGATAVVGALSMPTLVEAGIPVSDLDAGLLDLIARHALIVEARNAHADVHEAAERRFQKAMPARPETLWFVGRDIGFHLDAEATGRGVKASGRLEGFYQPGDVEKLRASPPVTRWAIASDDVDPPPREPDPRGEARRQEIIAASDRWEAEKRAVADRVGLTAAEFDDDRLYEAMWDARDAVRATAPVTLAGFQAKARWVLGLADRGQFDGDEDAESVVRDLAGIGWASS